MANIANKGDTIDILLNYTVDGETITEGYLDEIEFTIGSHQYTISNGGVVWDANAQMYKVKLHQDETFDLKQTTRWQLRVRKGTDVCSTDVAEVDLGEVLSRTVI